MQHTERDDPLTQQIPVPDVPIVTEDIDASYHDDEPDNTLLVRVARQQRDFNILPCVICCSF